MEDIAETSSDLKRTGVGRADSVAGLLGESVFSATREVAEACLTLIGVKTGLLEKAIEAWRLERVHVLISGAREDISKTNSR